MPLAEHDVDVVFVGGVGVVSIHVPLAEHDGLTAWSQGTARVSIHVPLAEHDVFGLLKTLN